MLEAIIHMDHRVQRCTHERISYTYAISTIRKYIFPMFCFSLCAVTFTNLYRCKYSHARSSLLACGRTPTSYSQPTSPPKLEGRLTTVSVDAMRVNKSCPCLSSSLRKKGRMKISLCMTPALHRATHCSKSICVRITRVLRATMKIEQFALIRNWFKSASSRGRITTTILGLLTHFLNTSRPSTRGTSVKGLWMHINKISPLLETQVRAAT